MIILIDYHNMYNHTLLCDGGSINEFIIENSMPITDNINNENENHLYQDNSINYKDRIKCKIHWLIYGRYDSYNSYSEFKKDFNPSISFKNSLKNAIKKDKIPKSSSKFENEGIMNDVRRSRLNDNNNRYNRFMTMFRQSK